MPKIHYKTIVTGIMSIANLNSTGRDEPINQLRLTIALHKAADILNARDKLRHKRLLFLLKACLLGIVLTLIWFVGMVAYILMK